MALPDLIRKNLHKTERLVTNNSPAILTVFGVVGVVGTAVLTNRATFKAAKILANEQYKRNVHHSGVGDAPLLTSKEKALLTWKVYLPAIGAGSLSIAAVIGAQYVNTKRMAAIAAGYMALEGKHEEYKEKVLELVGKKKAEEVDDRVAQSVANRASVQDVIIAAGDVACVDALSGRVFSSNMESLRKAENDINQRINHGDQPSVSDLYACLGIETNKMSDAFGWNDENYCEMKFTSKLGNNGEPYLVMDFSVLPVGNFWKVGR